MRRLSFLLLIFLSPLLNAQDYSFIWQNGVEALQNGDYIKGIERMTTYLQGNPGNPYALSNRGMAYYNMGDMEKACIDLQLANTLGYDQNKSFISYFCDLDYRVNLVKDEFYKDAVLIPEQGYRPAYTRKDTLRGALRPERNCFDVYFYNLSVRIKPASKSIEGNCQIWFHVENPTTRIQLDLASQLQIDSMVWKGRTLTYSREYEAIWVDFPQQLAKGTDELITVFYRGVPRVAPNPPWDGGFVWKHSAPLTWYVGVACEQLGASAWWPNKDYLADKPDSMGINIEVPSKYQAVCNGRLRNVVPKGKYKRYEWFVDYPINNYNATFYMGKFAEFTDTVNTLGDKLVCRYHVLPKNLEIAKEHFKQARDIVDCYSRAFGPFPFPKDNFRMVESPFEGMEHQTAIAYGNAYSNSKNSTAYLNKSFDYIIVHETAHEWWGNSINAADMADAWLQEGFATYAEYIFLEEKLGYTEALNELQNHMRYILNIWPMVQNYNVNENSFAGGDIYIKGATMLHCLRSIVANDSVFFGFIKGFYQTYQGKSIGTLDFLEYAKSYFSEDYTPFFKKFLYDVDLPVLSFSYKKSADGIVLKYKWIHVPDGFVMPFAVDYGDGRSERLMATTSQKEFLLKDTQSLSFYNMLHDLTNVPKFGFTYYNTHFE